MLTSRPMFSIFSFFLIAAVTLSLLAPSLTLPIRDGDQIGYLTELHGSTSLLDGLKLCDYGFARIYAKGDEILYRPLTFAWLAVQNSLFSYHAWPWNLSNILIHLSLLSVFFLLLNSLQPDIFSLLFVVLLATLRSSTPLALNQHLGGYLFGFLFYFAGLFFFYRLVSAPGNYHSKKIMAGYICFTAISGLFYELTIPFSLVALLFLINRAPKDFPVKRLGLFLLPLVIYAAAYALRDFSKTDRIFYVDGWSAGSILQERNFQDLLRYVKIMTLDLVTYVLDAPRSILFMAAAAVSAFLAPGLRSAAPVSFILKCFPVSLLVAYLFLLSFMRSGIFRDYYPYLFYYLLILTIYTAVDFSKLSRARRFIAAAALLGMIGLNILARHHENRENVDFYAPMAAYQKQLTDFVDARRTEPGFSFSIAQFPEEETDPSGEIKQGYPDGPAPSSFVRLSEIIFKKYYDSGSPAYRLSWDSSSKQLKAQKT